MQLFIGFRWNPQEFAATVFHFNGCFLVFLYKQCWLRCVMSSDIQCRKMNIIIVEDALIREIYNWFTRENNNVINTHITCISFDHFCHCHCHSQCLDVDAWNDSMNNFNSHTWNVFQNMFHIIGIWVASLYLEREQILNY